MRILEVLPNGGNGGMQVSVGRLVRGLREQGVDVLVAVGSRPRSSESGGDFALSFPEATSRPVDAARSAWALRSIVRMSKPDVVHGHGLRLAPILTAATAALWPAPLVVTCHGLPPEQVPGAVRMLKISRGVIASCGEGPLSLLAAHGVHGPLLRNGVPPPPRPVDRNALMRSLGLPEAMSLAISPGRLVVQKDHVTAIRTVHHLADTALLVIGNGPLKEELVAEAQALGVSTRLRLIEWRSDVRSLIGAADALLLPSRWEGHPLVAVEAMMAGVPVVAASSPGLREWLVHEENALLAPVGDHDQLARSLQRLFENGQVRSRVIAGGMQTATRYTITAMVADHTQIYRELIDEHRRS